MTISRLDRWLNVTGQLAVVIGLLVVAVELRQNSTIANGDLSAQYLTNWQVIDQAQMEPGFASVYAKSLERPEDLTLAEKVQLDGFYWSVMDQMDLALELVEAGIFNDSLEALWGPPTRSVLSSPYARAWWRWYREEFADTARIRIIEGELSRLPAGAALERFEAIDAHLRDLPR